MRPSIIFIDEIDSIIGGRNLTSADSKTVSVSERVLSALLNEMDGVQDSQGVLTIVSHVFVLIDRGQPIDLI